MLKKNVHIAPQCLSKLRRILQSRTYDENKCTKTEFVSTVYFSNEIPVMGPSKAQIEKYNSHENINLML